MRWKISHHGHDPRQIDFLTILALLIMIVAAYWYFTHHPDPPSTTAFIEPSQSVRWRGILFEALTGIRSASSAGQAFA